MEVDVYKSPLMDRNVHTFQCYFPDKEFYTLSDEKNKIRIRDLPQLDSLSPDSYCFFCPHSQPEAQLRSNLPFQCERGDGGKKSS